MQYYILQIENSWIDIKLRQNVVKNQQDHLQYIYTMFISWT